MQSTIKWRAPNPCLGSCESGSKLYTNFEFYEEKINIHLDNILIHKVKKFMMKKKMKKSLPILKEGASDVTASGPSNCLNFL